MPTIAECEAFLNEQVRTQTATLADKGQAINAKWPNQNDRMVSYDWVMKRADREVAEETAPISRTALKDMMANVNYNRATNRSKLVSAIERSVIPWLSV